MEKTRFPFEVLVSTMNRNSFEFLENMFQRNDINEHHILIVNQTTENNLLESQSPNIRVINSFEQGLSRSRNLAIENSIGEICLLADDDVVYLENFKETVINSYKSLSHADVVTFQTLTTKNTPYSKYPLKTQALGSFYKKVLSIEMSFKPDSLKTKNIKFNEFFGLGGEFQDGENALFLRRVNKEQLESYFVPKNIGIHKPKSSSDDISSDRIIYAKSAFYYKLMGSIAYFYLLKLIFFLIRKKLINFNVIIFKLKVGLKGIKRYKKICHK